MEQNKLFQMKFSKVYDAYLNKAQRKNRTQQEVNEIIFWLCGYDENTLKEVLKNEIDLQTFFNEAPKFNPLAYQIKGKVCSIDVQTIQDPLMQKIRFLDKLIDDLAKGKPLEKILFY